jgi:tRNA G18 (ribose-2'-O)-methylase SpoU
VLTVPWTRATPWPAAIDALAQHGFRVLALTPDTDAERLDDVAIGPDDRVAVLLGAEGPGLSAGAQGRAAGRVRIPMAAGVDSLNVAVAGAIAFAHCARPERLA